jgi:hypothetical protein
MRQPSHKTKWEKIRDHPIPWLLALIAALIAIGEPVHQALLWPEISAGSDVDVSRPFSLPFNTKNRSWLFDMKDAKLNCIIDKVVLKMGWSLEGLTLQGRSTTIAANTAGAFRCLIGPEQGNIFGATPANIVSAHIYLSMTYWTLLFRRNSPPIEFTWFTGVEPPRWIEGTISK